MSTPLGPPSGDAERHRRLLELFDEVRDLAPAGRHARLDAVRASDAQLADDLEAMLGAGRDATEHADSGDAPVELTSGLVRVPPAPRAPEVLGGYRIRRQLGQGGMGVVYEAEQERPQRIVALKVIRGELADDYLRRRFERESHILGRLAHPGISRIYEAGTDGDVCFFAMELVDGQPLGRYADARRLATPARLELLARVCEAVHHAHVKGIIHCDLKPANILVQEDGQPKVLDFGIAKIIDPDTALTGATLNGQIVGTPAYMSPEQTTCAAEVLDARSDIYTLGAIGYQLLSGALPHDDAAGGRSPPPSIHEVTRRIRERDVPPLSARRPELRGDVETILGKALAREPEARYQSAAALADDLRRHLRSEPIAARPPSAAYQLRLFARRNRALVAALAGLALALVAGAVTATVFAVRAERARALLAARNDALTVLEARASLREDPTRAAARLKGLSPAADWDDARAVALEAAHLGVAGRVLFGHQGEVLDAAFDPSGRWLASAGYDRTLRVWQLEQGRVVVVPLTAEAHLARFSSRGRLVVAGAGGELRLAEPGGDTSALAGHQGWVTAVAWAPDGSLLASAGADGSVRLWDAGGASRGVLSERGPEVTRLAWSPGGELVVAGDVAGTIRSWPAAGGAPRAVPAHRGEINDLVVAGDAVLSCGRDGRVVRTPTAPGDGAPTVLGEGPDEQKRVAATRDGRLIAWGDRGGQVTLHDLQTGAARIAGNARGVVRALAFSPDGQVLAAAGDGRVVALWSVSGGDRQDLLGHAGRVRQLAFSPDGQRLASTADDGTVRIWPVRAPFGAGARVVAVDPPRGQLAVAGPDEVIRVRRSEGGPVLRLAGHRDEIYQLAFSPDGAWLASASRDRTVRAWALDTGVSLELVLGERAVRVAFGAAGVAAAGADGKLVLWDPRTDSRTALGGHQGRVNDVRFSPDGRWVASGGDDGTVRLWPSGGGAGRELGSLGGRALVVGFSPDGARLAAGDDAGGVTVWEVERGREVARAGGGAGLVAALAFSSDGRLAWGGVDREIHLLGPEGQSRAAGRHAGPVAAVLFAGDTLVTTSADGTARAWREGGGRLLALGRGPVLDAALTGDGQLALVTGEDGLRLVPIAPAGGQAAVLRRLADLTRAALVADVLSEEWAARPGR